MGKIFVLTTAICRPRLHRQCLKPVIDALQRWHDEVIWLVNVDPAPMKSERLEGKTVANFERLGSGLGKVRVLRPVKDACFYLAVKRLVEAAEEEGVRDNDVVLYLEDDWSMRSEDWLEDLRSLLEHPRSYYRSLRTWGDRRDIDADHRAVYLSPALWSGDLFQMVFRQALISVSTDRPETVDAGRENVGVRDPEKVINACSETLSDNEFWNHRVLPARDDFVDQGRKWIAKQPYKKWKDKGQDFDAVSYIHIGWSGRLRGTVSRLLGRHRSKNP